MLFTRCGCGPEKSKVNTGKRLLPLMLCWHEFKDPTLACSCHNLGLELHGLGLLRTGYPLFLANAHEKVEPTMVEFGWLDPNTSLCHFVL